jgi:hypothetical protein
MRGFGHVRYLLPAVSAGKQKKSRQPGSGDGAMLPGAMPSSEPREAAKDAKHENYDYRQRRQAGPIAIANLQAIP